MMTSVGPNVFNPVQKQQALGGASEKTKTFLLAVSAVNSFARHQIGQDVIVDIEFDAQSRVSHLTTQLTSQTEPQTHPVDGRTFSLENTTVQGCIAFLWDQLSFSTDQNVLALLKPGRALSKSGVDDLFACSADSTTLKHFSGLGAKVPDDVATRALQHCGIINGNTVPGHAAAFLKTSAEAQPTTALFDAMVTLAELGVEFSPITQERTQSIGVAKANIIATELNQALGIDVHQKTVPYQNFKKMLERLSLPTAQQDLNDEIAVLYQAASDANQNIESAQAEQQTAAVAHLARHLESVANRTSARAFTAAVNTLISDTTETLSMAFMRALDKVEAYQDQVNIAHTLV